jgi:preprotein translocase subunit SecE
MPTQEDLKKGTPDEPGGEAELAQSDQHDENVVGADVRFADAENPVAEGGDDDLNVPTQLGTQRFVYAAYFAGGIAVAFLLSKLVSMVWTRLSLYKPQFGEPHEEIVMPIAALIGTAVAVYYYRDQKTRTLVDEVASELSKVTWPTRQEVINSTFVVIVTTLVATTFFALMDRFWGFVTNLVYGA